MCYDGTERGSGAEGEISHVLLLLDQIATEVWPTSIGEGCGGLEHKAERALTWCCAALYWRDSQAMHYSLHEGKKPSELFSGTFDAVCCSTISLRSDQSCGHSGPFRFSF